MCAGSSVLIVLVTALTIGVLVLTAGLVVLTRYAPSSFLLCFRQPLDSLSGDFNDGNAVLNCGPVLLISKYILDVY